LVDKVKYYLKNEEERNQIVKNAYEITSKYNTWEHRADEILQIYDEIRKEQIK
jgi:spore maturation protein CgeB